MSARVMVNVGCGRTWHRDWINLDHRPSSPEVRRFDLRRPLPFSDGTVDVVYASHVLEHLDSTEGRQLLEDCRRILKPGGIVRIVVPDLEELCRFYLQRLAAVTERPGTENEQAYDWAYLQMIDQHVRRRGGGDLMVYLDRPGLLGNPALDNWLSHEARNLVRQRNDRRRAGKPAQPERGVRAIVRRGVVRLVRGVLPTTFTEALRTARFLQTGEAHRVAYDRFSLSRLLQDVGFDDVAVVDAFKSSIPGFDAMELDCVDGVPRKPGSLFVEAVLQPRDNVAPIPPQRTIRDAAA